MFVACSMPILLLLLIVEIVKQFEGHLEDIFRHFIGCICNRVIKKLKTDYLLLKIITSCSSYFQLQDLKSSSESQLIKPPESQCCHVIRRIKAHLCFWKMLEITSLLTATTASFSACKLYYMCKLHSCVGRCLFFIVCPLSCCVDLMLR